MKKSYFIINLCLLFFLLSCKSSKSIESNYYDDYIPRYSFGEEITLPKLSDDEFTLAVVPDTQSYLYRGYQTDRKRKFPMNQYEILNRQIEFIAKNAESNGGAIPFVVMLGDIVDSFNWFKYEWDKADEAFSILDGVVPISFIIGNHDYDRQVFKKEGGYHVKGTKYFNKYFGPNSKYYKNKDWFGGASKSGLSNFCFFTGGGQQFIVLGLEMEPSNEELEWADSIVKKYKNIPVILSTHAYLGLGKDPLIPSNANYLPVTYKPEENANSAKQIFDKLIYPNKNILFVLSGHCFQEGLGESSRIDINQDGYPVYSLMSDYQGRDDIYKTRGYAGEANDCGDGWMRLMNFNMKNKNVHIQTYSTEFNTFETDSNSDFIIQFDFDWDARFN